MTAPAVYAEGLRVLWLLFSRGVSATWNGTAVGVAPPDPTADGAIEELAAVLRPDADGRSYLQRARARHALFLREVNDAKPADATNRQWRDAIEGLESFLLSGWGDEALHLGWPHDELYAVPPLWSRVDLCGVGLAIGDREVVSIAADRIQIKAPSGSVLSFYRKPTVDYRLVFETQLKLIRGNYPGGAEESRLRAFEFAVRFCRDHNRDLDLETAKTMVAAAIKRSAAK
jgi:hypothetical protein